MHISERDFPKKLLKKNPSTSDEKKTTTIT